MKIVYRRSELMKQLAELEDIPDEYTYNSNEVWEEMEAKLDAQQAAKRKHASILARMTLWYTTVGKRVAILVVLCILLRILLPVIDKPATIPGTGRIEQRQYTFIPGSNSKNVVPIERKQAGNIPHHRKLVKQVIVKEPVKVIDSTIDKNNNSMATVLKLPDSSYINPDPIKQIAVQPKLKFRIVHANIDYRQEETKAAKAVDTQVVLIKKELRWYSNPG